MNQLAKTHGDFMCELSTQTDPQTAATLYGRRLRKWGMFPCAEEAEAAV
jgi:hypothetical protein